MVADFGGWLFDRRRCDRRGVAMDADRHQAHQRCAAGDRARSSRAAGARAGDQMGCAPRRAHRPRRARDVRILVGMPDAHRMISGVRYAYKASLIGAAHRFELTDEGLSWQIGGRAGVWPYDGISAIRLSYRPVSMQSRRFRADIESASLES